MRLIDADKRIDELKAFVNSDIATKEDKESAGRIATYIETVAQAPTVEAIPISFIKEIIGIWESFAPGYCEVTSRDFEWLIEKWEYDRDLEQLKSELKKIEEDAFK